MASKDNQTKIKALFVREALWSAPWDVSDMSSRIEVGVTPNLNAITLDMGSGIITLDTTEGAIYLHLSAVRMVKG